MNCWIVGRRSGRSLCIREVNLYREIDLQCDIIPRREIDLQQKSRLLRQRLFRFEFFIKVLRGYLLGVNCA